MRWWLLLTSAPCFNNQLKNLYTILQIVLFSFIFTIPCMPMTNSLPALSQSTLALKSPITKILSLFFTFLIVQLRQPQKLSVGLTYNWKIPVTSQTRQGVASRQVASCLIRIPMISGFLGICWYQHYHSTCMWFSLFSPRINQRVFLFKLCFL